jgi:protocatechuate 3,4-dioxygenase beta subunit/5-hydroxyisourate hydrolase-like protein (transthyretin family)
MRRSAVLILLLFCAAAVVMLLLQTGGGDDRSSSRRNESRQGPGAAGFEEGVEADTSSGGAASGGGNAAALDDDPNRVPGAELVLTGRVVRDGTGVEGATVAAIRAGSTDNSGSRWMTQAFDMPPPPVATTASGPGGRFELRIARRTRVILRAAKKGSGSGSLFLLMPPEGNPPEVTLRLRPGGTLEGLVVNEKGDPVEGADVALGTQDWQRSVMEMATRTDAEGRFVLDDVPDGSYRIRAQAAGYPEARHWANVPTQKFVRVELRPAGIVLGTVRDGSGAAIAGARIMLSTSAWERGGAGGIAKGETDAEGAYRLEIYPGGVQSAVVEHRRYGRHVASNETFDLPTALVETGKELKYDIKLRKGVPVRGIAVYAETGEPAKGTNVVLLRMAQQWRGMNDADSVRADDSGRFEFPYVTEGTYGLEAKGENGARLATRYAQANQRVTIDFFVDGESAVPEQRLELLAMGGVRGRIKGIGEPDPYQRPNVYLQVGTNWVSATVDDLGVYEMTHVPPMEGAVLQSQNPQAKSEPFAVEAGKIAEVDLDAAKVGITGLVEDEKGKPVARARVHLIPQAQLQQQLPQYTQNRGWGGALTDEQGRFNANAGNWAGDYWASQKFVAVAMRQGYAVAISEAFDLPKEGNPGPEIRLVLAQGGVVRGRVEHAGGAPAMNISVSMSPKPEQKQDQPVIETRAAQSAYTGFDGTFEIAGVGDGVYMISAYHPEGKIESREVRAGAEGVKLVIEPAFAISGVVVTEAGSPVAYAQVSVIVPKERGEQPQMGQTQANGRFRIGQLALGSYAVEASPNPQQYGGMRGFEKKRVEAVAAGTEDLVIVVSEGKGLRGRVEDEAGKPVPGAGVIAMPLEAKPQQRPQAGQPYQSVEMQSAPSATTNGKGEFEIKGVGDGEVEVIAIADGYTPTSQRGVGGGAPVNIRLSGGEVIEGRLLKADGTPLPRVWIWLQPMTKETNDKIQDWQRRGGQAWNNLGGWNMSSATTDADGKFRLSSLLPGEYRVQAQQQADEVLPQTTLRTGTTSATLRYERALSVKGRVTDAAGRPIALPAGQRLHVSARLGQQWISSAMIGDDGSFEIRGLPTGSTVTLQVWAGNEWKPATVDAVAGAAGVSIVLEKNEAQPKPPTK